MPAAADSTARVLAPVAAAAAVPVGAVAALLAEALAGGDVLFAAADDARADAVFRALAAMTAATVVLFPASDALPGEEAAASPANVGQRVAALRRLRLAQVEADLAPIACVTTGEALARAYATPAAFAASPPRVTVGEAVDLAALFGQLADLGYHSDERVDEPGEIALRGQVLDVYPADAVEPLRIEAEDGRIVGLRSFDPATQRTTGDCGPRELGRVSEPDLDDAGVTLLDHLQNAGLAIEPAAEDRRKRFLALAADGERRRPKRALRAIVTEKTWQAAASKRRSLAIESTGEGDAPRRFIEGKAPLRAFARRARAAFDAGDRVVLLGSARDLRFLSGRAAAALKCEVVRVSCWSDVRSGDVGTLLTLEAPVDRGFHRAGVLAVAAADLLGSRAERDDAQTGAADLTAFALGEIRVGDVVVHEDHGIGVVAGLADMPESEGGAAGEGIALTYADNGVRLVPVTEADRLWRYGGDADAVPFDKLDGSTWQKRRGAIDIAIAETARSMTELAKARATRSAAVLDPDTAAYERFVAGFAYSETHDQARAIDAVRADLASGTPMDRLLVGDVGFGKTEVALRAAALAALAGHQVAIAAPTTLLARQHIETFTERFENTGITVAGLSRLSSTAERKRVKAGVADGSIQVVVGTGAVAGKGIAYHNLALVVIDEEQRFGTADKQRLRDLGNVHILAMSATPIPRTLQTALVGIQQLSVIATPPSRRQPIRTAVGAFDEATLRAALLRERGRGGQNFVVVPRIEDMAKLADLLARLVPELEVLQAHGKLPAAEIDEAMVRFGRGDGDVLLATNIIEAGLDVPRANTMVIWRADRFGLSQLHQLRGRVGRGSRRGQVLLFTEPDKEIAPRTLKRLRTLEAFERLGAGFAISAQDLDMRGAGDLVGEAQAGHMKLIGVDLYQHLLEGALRTARGETVDRWTPELHLGMAGRVPESWVPDTELRVTLYIRIARADTAAAIDALHAELEDRFGALPDEAVTLLKIARARASALALGIVRIDAGPAAIAFTPRAEFHADAAAAGLTRKGDRYLLPERIDDATTRVDRLLAVLEDLEASD